MNYLQNVDLTSIIEFVIQFLIVVVGASAAYLFGLKAYFKQKEYENFRKRYLDEGLDLWASQLDYALGVYRQNWALMARVLKQYRDAAELTKFEDFTNQFVELNLTMFHTGPNARIQDILGTHNLWIAYQCVFSFVGITNDLIRGDFGTGLRGLLSDSNNAKNEKFIEKAIQEIERLDMEVGQYYQISHLIFILSNLLEKSTYTTKTMNAFQKRDDVQEILEKIASLLPDDMLASSD